jgi:hypothetical protein
LHVTLSGVAEPVGTYLASVRNGSMQLPPLIAQYCAERGWTLFRFEVADRDHVTILPVLPADRTEFHASLGEDGKLWMPAEFREKVQLGEQSVMLRVENGAINIYLRKVFETLGFRPA